MRPRPRAWVMRAEGVGWASRDWNWGSASGTAHDMAMALREKLRVHPDPNTDPNPEPPTLTLALTLPPPTYTQQKTKKSRLSWAERVVRGEVDMLEVTLALGLRIQHAARAGMDGDGAGWNLMMNLAACIYEDDDVALHVDLKRLVGALMVDDRSRALADESVYAAALVALGAMGFYESGL
uniref:Uncharacterized protein n=2 Tax=Phaeomonas parva TaxID=124430 RepID=A0A7S1TQ55_9STRA|mmetsp:Transcript_11473/g.34823  ORF Transcript_11473/g.34823 Transcript_11473/m.34823 type:complete len:181 (+) Transcript_11473:115-657(+)